MTKRLLVYGATGYTGRLIVRKAQELELDVVLGGRNPTALRALSRELVLPWRAAAVESQGELRQALADIDVVFNAASPYTITAPALVQACLHLDIHYLDACAQLDLFRTIDEHVTEIEYNPVMVMQGIGLSVLASEFLANHLVNNLLPETRWLRIALSRVPALSAGSALTAFESIRDTVCVVRAGKLKSLPLGRLERHFDFRMDREIPAATGVNLADTYAARKSTAVPNIESYTAASLPLRVLYQAGQWVAGVAQLEPVANVIEQNAGWLPNWLPQRLDAGLSVLVEAEDTWRRTVSARLDIADTYAFTARAAAVIAKLVIDDDFEPGYHTPGEIYCGHAELSSVFETPPVYLTTLGSGPSAQPAWITGETPGRAGAGTPVLRAPPPRRRAPIQTGSFSDLTFDPQIPPPYEFVNVKVRGFKVAASLAKLEALCEELLGTQRYDDSETFKWRPASNYVLLELLTYESMSSSSGKGLALCGATGQHELLFRLLVGKADQRTGYTTGHEVAMFCPFIFVDNIWSMITGREVIGYPKLLADFGEGDPASPDTATRITTHVFVPGEGSAPGKLVTAPLLEVVPGVAAQGRELSLFKGPYVTWLWEDKELNNKGSSGDELKTSAFNVVEQSFARWNTDNTVGTVQLMQFRDGRDGGQARLRHLVEGIYTVARPTGRVQANADLRLYSYESLKIAETLGLQGVPNIVDGRTEWTISPVFAYSATCDMTWNMA